MSEIRPEQIPTTLMQPAMDAGHPPDAAPCALPGWEPMKGVTPDGRIVDLTVEQARTVRLVGEWARNRHPVPVVLPNMGRAGGKSVILATVARYDALGWPADLPEPPAKQPAWDACPKSEAKDGAHSLVWYDHGGQCSWCGNVAERCPDCGVILTMHHSPGCSLPCGRCAERLSFDSGDLERYIAAAKRIQEDFAAKVGAMLPDGFYVSFGERAR
jgi:hypothetical protein